MIGKKLGMTGLFLSDGRYVPVTVVQAGPCVITQIKTIAIDGYDALQLGFGDKKTHKVNKPLQGHYNKSGDRLFSVMREFPVDNPENYNVGQEIKAEMFEIGEIINVSGTIKGRGFAGVIKRHGFHGGRKTHGSRSHRVPGSIGCSAWPAKVIKGKKLPGHYGNTRQTAKNLEIIDIRHEENLILIKGAVPGHKNSIVGIKKQKLL